MLSRLLAISCAMQHHFLNPTSVTTPPRYFFHAMSHPLPLFYLVVTQLTFPRSTVKSVSHSTAQEDTRNTSPMSAAVFDPTLHDVTINNSIIQRIIIAVDKNGLFTGLLNMDLYLTSEKGESILLHNPTHRKETCPHTGTGTSDSTNMCWGPLLQKVINKLTFHFTERKALILAQLKID